MPQPELPLIIDVEASGFGAGSYPIEIGLALEPEHRYCSLIRPAEHWTHWCEEAEGYHHISRELLFAHGREPETVAADINRLLAGLTVYSDGWVVDKPWVIRLFEQARMSMEFRLSALEMILSEAQMAIWHRTREQVIGELNIRRHRASNDALIIQQTWLRTRRLTT